jgi:hypothetical protein
LLGSYKILCPNVFILTEWKLVFFRVRRHVCYILIFQYCRIALLFVEDLVNWTIQQIRFAQSGMVE